MEIRGRRVVAARRADHIDALEAQLGFQPAQRVDLARNADDADALEACGAGRFQQRQQRRIAHPHAAHLGHGFGLRHQHRARLPLVLRVGRHGEDGVHRAGFQQTLTQPAGDASPLRALTGLFQPGFGHALERAEEQLVGARFIAGTAVHGGFHRGIIRLDELAGGAAIRGGGRARHTAIGAQPARGSGRKFRRDQAGFSHLCPHDHRHPCLCGC